MTNREIFAQIEEKMGAFHRYGALNGIEDIATEMRDINKWLERFYINDPKEKVRIINEYLERKKKVAWREERAYEAPTTPTEEVKPRGVNFVHQRAIHCKPFDDLNTTYTEYMASENKIIACFILNKSVDLSLFKNLEKYTCRKPNRVPGTIMTNERTQYFNVKLTTQNDIVYIDDNFYIEDWQIMCAGRGSVEQLFVALVKA